MTMYSYTVITRLSRRMERREKRRAMGMQALYCSHVLYRSCRKYETGLRYIHGQGCTKLPKGAETVVLSGYRRHRIARASGAGPRQRSADDW